MTVDFALFVSPEGIALAHRQAAGHWAFVGEAPFDPDTLDTEMARLNAIAVARIGTGGGKPRILLVLPDDQILYTSFMAPASDPALVADRITGGLDGMTPYAVPDLAYDWRAVEDDRVKVAVVAKETLEEAAGFAGGYGFETAGFAAMPPAERYPGMPLFGDARPDLPGLEGGMAFGSDDWVDPATQVTAPPEPTPTPDVTPAAEAPPKDAKTPEADPEAKADAPDKVDDPAPDVAAAPPAQAEEPAPQPTPPKAKAEPVAPAPEEVSAAPAADAAAPVEASSAEPEEEDTPPSLIGDPTLDRPIESITEDDPEDPARTAEPAPKADAALKEKPKAEPSASPEPDTKPATDMPVVPAQAPAETEAQTPPPEVEPVPPAPVASRGKAAKPAGKTPPLTAKKPAGSPPRAPRFTPSLPDESLPDQPDSAPDETDADTPAETPSFRFGAQRGKAARPEGDASQLLSNRRSRIGFGAAGDSAGPVLHPDAAPPSRSAPIAPPASGGGAVKPPGKLAAQLARVREASKARTKPELTPSARPDDSAPATPAISDPTPGTPARAVPASEDTGAGALSGAMFRRRSSSKTPAATAEPSGATTTADAAFTSGLLARKPTEQAGPSFKTGLILTIILLVLLALIAVWSVLFLPDSPMARLFGGGSQSETAMLDDSAPDGPAPPAAFSAPPAIGALDTGAAVQDPGTADPDAAAEEVAALVPLSDREADAPAPAAPETPLPDIDADLDLPPLPPLPEELLPTREETERIYAEDGIWPRTPDRPSFAPFQIVDDVYLASIDPDVTAFDAVALADPGINPSEVLRRVPAPPPFGAEITRDERGLVAATPEGVLTPEGAFVVLGRPPVDAVPRPREVAPAVPETPLVDTDEAVLGAFPPAPRPTDLDETRERQLLGGLSRTELAGLTPAPRPLSAQESAAQASLFPQQDAPDDAAEAAEQEVAGTLLAVSSSRLPRSRPADIASIVAAAERAPATAVAANAVAPPPSIPSNADVSRAATERNAIRLRDVNLIGVTGTSSNRRALVRLPSGRFVRVGVGDRLDGGRVAAIGEASLQYVRNGRNVTLEIPG